MLSLRAIQNNIAQGLELLTLALVLENDKMLNAFDLDEKNSSTTKLRNLRR
jgi:hypothetical protein